MRNPNTKIDAHSNKTANEMTYDEIIYFAEELNKRKNHRKASSVLLSQLHKWNDNCDYICTLGHHLTRLKEFEKLDKLYSDYLMINPNDCKVLTIYAKSLGFRNKFIKAEGLFKKALHINPQNLHARGSFISMQLRRGCNEEAIALVDYIFSIAHLNEANNHINATGIIKISTTLLRHNHVQKALDTIDKAISLSGPNAKSQKLRGDILYKLGRYNDAVEQYKDNLKSITDDYKSMLSNLVGLINTGNTRYALDHIEKLVHDPKHSSEIQSHYGVLLSHLGHTPKRSKLRKLKYKALFSLATALSKKERFQDAIKVFEIGFERQFNQQELLRSYSITLNRYSKTLMHSKKTEEAISIIKKGLEKDPQNKISMSILGKMYVNQKEFEAAYHILKQSLEIDDSDHITYYDLACVCEEMTLLEEALTMTEKGLTFKSNDTRLNIKYGVLLCKLDKTAEGLSHLKETYAKYPREIHVITEYAKLLAEQEKNEEAIAIIKKGLTFKPKDKFFHSLLGSIYLKLANYKEACDALEKAITEDPTNTHTLTYFARTLFKANRVDDAISTFQKAIRLDPKNIFVLNNYSITLSKLGNFEEAEYICKKALAIDSEHPEVVSNYAIILSRLGQSQLSIEYFQKALRIEPDNILTIQSYAEALYISKRATEAVQVLSPHIKRADVSRDIRQRYAKYLYGAKMVHEAIQYTKQLIQNDESTYWLKIKYAKALSEQGKDDTAIQVLEELLKDENDNPSIFIQYGNLLWKLEAYDEAIDIYESALQANPLNQRLTTLTALRYEEMKNFKRAVEILEQDFLSKNNITEYERKAEFYRTLHLIRLHSRLRSTSKVIKLLEDRAHTLSDEPKDKINRMIMTNKLVSSSNRHYNHDDFEAFGNPSSYSMNLSEEIFFDSIETNFEESVKNRTSLNRSLYHKIQNELSILDEQIYDYHKKHTEDEVLLKVKKTIGELLASVKKERETEKKNIAEFNPQSLESIIEAVSETAHNISDQVGNKLSFAYEYIFMKESNCTNDDQKRIYTQILTLIRNVMTTINSIKSVNESLRLTTVEINTKDLLENWCINPTFKGVSIIIENNLSPQFLIIDNQKVNAIINELIENCVSHNASLVNLVIKVEITLGLSPHAKYLPKSAQRAQAKYIIFKVKDNGMGVPYSKKQWIFLPLSTTSKAGTGLGLFLVRRMVQSMRGFIKETGTAGACFEIYVPLR